ncbi:hypothetical protein D3C84_1168300 [compost metagenome]
MREYLSDRAVVQDGFKVIIVLRADPAAKPNVRVVIRHTCHRDYFTRIDFHSNGKPDFRIFRTFSFIRRRADFFDLVDNRLLRR